MELHGRLKEYLAVRMGRQSKDLTITDFQKAPTGGSRESYTFTLEREEGNIRLAGRYVLRRDPDASLLESDRETEFRVLKALEGSGVPAPRVYWLEKENNAYLDRPFIIMEQVMGDVTPFSQLICPNDPSLRQKRAHETAAALAGLHQLDWERQGLGFLGIPAGPTGYAETQVNRWEEDFKRFKLNAQPILTDAFIWLHRHIPEARNTTFLHGDFKADNIMYDGSMVKALLDWEMTGIGDPVADLAWFCLDRWSVDGLCCGLVAKEDFISMWKELSGLEVEETSFLFWTVFSNVKMAVIHLNGGHSFCLRTTNNLRMAYTPYENVSVLREICNLLGF
jgi:aminoglycoside phosphotransferase (APT) family kinase protein